MVGSGTSCRSAAERQRHLPVSSVAALRRRSGRAMSLRATVERGRFRQPVMRMLGGRVATECGRGAYAEIDPLLMMRPPRGVCAFMMRIASCVTNVPFNSIDHRLPLLVRQSSIGIGGVPMPALFEEHVEPAEALFRSSRTAREPTPIFHIGWNRDARDARRRRP